MSESDLLSDTASTITEQSTPQRHPVKYLDRCSLYRKYIYDVDGKVVLGKEKKPVSVFSPEIKELIVRGNIRFIYDLPNEYRYIITNYEQYVRFIYERRHGSFNPHKYYHVYVDDDVRGKFPIARRRTSFDGRDPQQTVSPLGKR